MNNITIELCAEDRARLEKLTNALMNLSEDIRDNKPACESCVKTVTNVLNAAQAEQPAEPVQKAKKTPTLPEAPPEEEKPTAPEKPAQNNAPTVTAAEVQQKVVSLSATGKKAQVRDIVMAYASKVSEIPEDKLAEVLEKLNALED